MAAQLLMGPNREILCIPRNILGILKEDKMNTFAVARFPYTRLAMF
jgi:hypothetical protein